MPIATFSRTVRESHYLPALSAGESLGTLALAEPSGDGSLDSLSCTATGRGGTWTVDGTKTFVIDGAQADLILVVTGTAGGPALFAVQANAPGLERRALETMDLTRRQARLDFHQTPAVKIGRTDRTPATIATVLDHAVTAPQRRGRREPARRRLRRDAVGGAEIPGPDHGFRSLPAARDAGGGTRVP
jgi:hypothetical protein